MPPRAIASGTISFGLVAVPVKIFSAATSEKVRFTMLETSTGSRLKQQYVSKGTGAVVERKDIVRAVEHARGHYVVLEDAEIKALEAEASGEIALEAFVPAAEVDLVQVEKSFYLGPDKGAAKAYRLLSEAMRRQERVAIGRYRARGKEQLVMLRPYKDGLLLHQLYYGSEVRAFEVGVDMATPLSEVELELAERLVAQLSAEHFEPGRYADSYRERVLALVEQKIAGLAITASAPEPKAQIIDLFEALKQSLEPMPLKKAQPKKARQRAAT